MASATDASDFGIPEGSLLIWAGDADDAGHVEEDEWRFLPPEGHDGIRNEHGVVICGPEAERWIQASVAEMLLGLR